MQSLADGLPDPLLQADREQVSPQDTERLSNGTSEWGAVITLTLTAMGAGVLGLPISLHYGGWIVGLVVLALFAIVSDYSLLLLVRCADIVRPKERSISGMAGALWGLRGEIAVTAITAVLLFGAQIAMLIIIGDVLTPVIQYFATGDIYKISCDDHETDCDPGLWAGTTRCDAQCTSPPWYTGRFVVTSLSVVLFYPLTLFDNLSALSYSSSFAVGALFFVIIALCIEFGENGVADDLSEATGSWRIMMIPSILACAFCCHFNVLEVQQEMRPSIQHKIERVIHQSMVGCVFLMYAVCALSGYLIFGNSVSDCPDILTCFKPDDKLMLICSVAIGLVNIVKMPLIILPARKTGAILYSQISRLQGASRSGSGCEDQLGSNLTIGTADGSVGVSFFNWNLRLFCNLCLSSVAVKMLILCLVDLALATALHSLTLGFSLLACSSGVPICYIIPGLLYDAALTRQWKLEGGLDIHEEGKLELNKKRRGPLALVLFGFVTLVVAFVGIAFLIAFGS